MSIYLSYQMLYIKNLGNIVLLKAKYILCQKICSLDTIQFLTFLRSIVFFKTRYFFVLNDKFHKTW